MVQYLLFDYIFTKGAIFLKFTNQQKQAILHTDGTVLVNSGAGSGKTQVFVSRIINLIANHKVNPCSVLGLTFTRSAADNMRERIKKYIPEGVSNQVNLSTFHSFARSVLHSNYPQEYMNRTIPKDWWKMRTVSDLIEKDSYKNPNGLDMKIHPGDLLAFISYQKANMIRQGDEVIINNRVQYAMGEPREKLQKAYDKYCELSKNANIMDFDDMLIELYYKLKEDKSLVESMKNKYKYIMVDEFQDTSKINMEILKMIYQDNLFVVGDFRQSIMGFNNSEINNILDFTDNFPNAEVINLPHNFRSTNQIIDISNDLISASPIEKYKSFDKQVSGKDLSGDEVVISVYTNDVEECLSIVNDIQSKSESSDLTYNDFCILCRTNAQLAVFESLLSDKNIPARLSSQGSFFDRKEIMDILAYCKHAIDRDDDMSLREIINVPNRYIANAAVHQLDSYATNNEITLERAIWRDESVKYRKQLISIINLFDDLSVIASLPPHKFIQRLINRIGYFDYLEEKAKSNIELITRKESVEKLIEIAKKYPTINSLLAGIEVIKANSKNKDDAVNVMTVHASKGLEFYAVYVSGASDNMFPHAMAAGNEEEERRLLYVALSRAISKLNISFCASGLSSNTNISASPFLVDIAGEDIKKALSALKSGINCYRFNYKKPDNSNDSDDLH